MFIVQPKSSARENDGNLDDSWGAEKEAFLLMPILVDFLYGRDQVNVDRYGLL
jgi:hypothetical protein